LIFDPCYRPQIQRTGRLQRKALMALMIAVAAITRANWRNICPVIPAKRRRQKHRAAPT
jgi:hypothetical protein